MDKSLLRKEECIDMICTAVVEGSRAAKKVLVSLGTNAVLVPVRIFRRKLSQSRAACGAACCALCAHHRRVIPILSDFISDINKQLLRCIGACAMDRAVFTAQYGANEDGE